MSMFDPTRRGVLAGSTSVVLASTPLLAAKPPRDITLVQDFDELWQTLADRYCYFGDKTTDWNRVRALYRPQAEAARSTDDLARVAASVLDELYDAHTHLSDPATGSPRFPPFDLVVNREREGARVAAVLDLSSADVAGVKAGDLVTHVEGVPATRMAASLMPRCLARPDPAANSHAWNAAVAGRRGQPRRLTIAGRGDVALPLTRREAEPSLSWRRLDNGLGCIRIASFGDQETVAAFDVALVGLRDTRGLVLDVRNNGGGDTAVARPIMGRFITRVMPYATMRRRDGKGLGAAWTETVDPRGPFTYSAPVVVLCDHWSASMAEGFPMGMRSVCDATMIGTPMMGLGAAVFRIRLDRTGIEAQYSAEPVYDVVGHPRWLLRPDVEVDPGRDIMAAGVEHLRKRLAGSV